MENSWIRLEEYSGFLHEINNTHKKPEHSDKKKTKTIFSFSQVVAVISKIAEHIIVDNGNDEKNGREEINILYRIK